MVIVLIWDPHTLCDRCCEQIGVPICIPQQTCDVSRTTNKTSDIVTELKYGYQK